MRVYESYIQPFYQYEKWFFGCTSKTNIDKLQKQQVFLMRMEKKLDEVRLTRQKFKVYSIYELHTYEVFKIIRK